MNALDKDDQICYVKVIDAVIKLLQAQYTELPAHHELLGEVAYHSPKMPGKPITTAYYHNLLVCKNLDLSVAVERRANESVWSIANVGTRGMSMKFLANISRTVFDSLNISPNGVKTSEGAQEYKTFAYRTKSSPVLSVDFFVEARGYTKEMDYPKNFTFVYISAAQ